MRDSESYTWSVLKSFISSVSLWTMTTTLFYIEYNHEHNDIENYMSYDVADKSRTPNFQTYN